jgi:hypothetical protein
VKLTGDPLGIVMLVSVTWSLRTSGSEMMYSQAPIEAPSNRKYARSTKFHSTPKKASLFLHGAFAYVRVFVCI